MALCDDIIDYNKKMESYIEKYGNENHVEVKITSYGSGSQLLLNYQKRKFDVIFLDVSMPEMDGFETAEEIRKSDTDVSIVFCTSYYTITNAGKGFEVAAEDFLSKPLLYRKVENILNKIYKKKLLNAEEKLFLKCHDGLITLQLSDIIYIQTEIIERIPPHLSSINVMTIFIPLLLNIIVMAVCTDNLYNDKKVIIGNIWSVITISIVPIVMFLGTVCNIVILENYLNVKKIENEKKLQISEMSLQYDYYMKQSKDMENIRRLSHDIKNHLEALKENIEPEQKIEYINGIERKLNKYQSYYKSGNTFIDNLLHTKRLEAIEKGIEFKVFADFTEFRQIRNEDLCVIISNTIDNALRECRLMKEENPMVECLVQLKAKKVKGFLSILCENSLRDSQVRYLRENATLETSKEDKKNHGFGVKNIKSVVKDYGGEVSFSVLDDMFSVSVIIPIEI